MKRLILSAAVLAIVASCSTNEVADVAPSMQNAIGFSTLNDRVTKGANDADANYVVYANLASDATSFFMDAVTVDGGDGTTGTPYYWPATATSYVFYAYAPQGSSNMGEVSAAVDAISFDYTVGENADEDFTIATPKEASSGSVVLEFSHMLSKISVTYDLCQDLLDANYTIDSDATVEFVVANDAATFTVAPDAGFSAYTASSASATYEGAASYMFMPQTSTDCTVTLVGVTVTAPDGSATTFAESTLETYTIAAGDVTDNSFVAGTHYALAIEINASTKDDDDKPLLGDEITFKASVSWDEASWNEVLGSDDEEL